MMANYKRLALINTGQYEIERYRDYARRTAERFGLRYEEIPGATTLVEKLLFGPWDDELSSCLPAKRSNSDTSSACRARRQSSCSLSAKN